MIYTRGYLRENGYKGTTIPNGFSRAAVGRFALPKLLRRTSRCREYPFRYLVVLLDVIPLLTACLRL